jgi:hypothetical protein
LGFALDLSDGRQILTDDLINVSDCVHFIETGEFSHVVNVVLVAERFGAGNSFSVNWLPSVPPRHDWNLFRGDAGCDLG